MKHAELGVIIKRVTAVAADGALTLAGDGPCPARPWRSVTASREALLGRARLRIARPPGSAARLARGALIMPALR